MFFKVEKLCQRSNDSLQISGLPTCPKPFSRESDTENVISQRIEEYDLLEIFCFIYFTDKIKIYSYPFYASPRNIRLALLKQFKQ